MTTQPPSPKSPLPKTPSRPQTSRRSPSLFPKSLSQCIEPITRPIFKTQGLAGSRIISEWASIAGRHLSEHCIPHKLTFPAGKKTGGTLSIAVENGFATELQHLQPQILERLATYFGYKAVTRITIAHTYVPAALTPAATPPAKAPPSKKTPTTENYTALTHGVEDPELRAALQNMANFLEK